MHLLFFLAGYNDDMEATPSQKKSRWNVPMIILAAVIVLALGFAGFRYWQSRGENYLAEDDAHPDVMTAYLEPRPDVLGQGNATRVYQDDELSVTVAVTGLAPLNQDRYYQAWLVSQTTPVEYLSLGRLESQEVGIWGTFYTDKDDLPEYKTVWITEESVMDQIPETLRLTGEFK